MSQSMEHYSRVFTFEDSSYLRSCRAAMKTVLFLILIGTQCQGKGIIDKTVNLLKEILCAPHLMSRVTSTSVWDAGTSQASAVIPGATSGSQRTIHSPTLAASPPWAQKVDFYFLNFASTVTLFAVSHENQNPCDPRLVAVIITPVL